MVKCITLASKYHPRCLSTKLTDSEIVILIVLKRKNVYVKMQLEAVYYKQKDMGFRDKRTFI
jgi:hypothetical protein